MIKIGVNPNQQARLVTALRVLTVVEALLWLYAALLHTGVQLPVVSEPPMLAAMIAESIGGLGLAVAAFVLLTGRRSAWITALAAHILALADVLLGISVLTLGFGSSTALNSLIFHPLMLVLAIAGLLLLLMPGVKAALQRAG